MFDEPTTPKKCHYLVFAFLDFNNVSGFLLALIKGNYHENLLTVHSQNFHHRVIGIPASSSKFHHEFDFVHGVLQCSWVATSGSTDRGFSQWANAGLGVIGSIFGFGGY
ncbi:hypothetical protein FCV25MIE_20664 [Fagus crenata]